MWQNRINLFNSLLLSLSLANGQAHTHIKIKLADIYVNDKVLCFLFTMVASVLVIHLEILLLRLVVVATIILKPPNVWTPSSAVVKKSS